MNKDIKLQMAINKMTGKFCTVHNIDVMVMHCPQINLDKDSCIGCPYHNPHNFSTYHKGLT
jgi:hypothetical protein